SEFGERTTDIDVDLDVNTTAVDPVQVPVQGGDLAGDPVRAKPPFVRPDLPLDPGLDAPPPLPPAPPHGRGDSAQLPPHLRVEPAQIGADGDERRSSLRRHTHPLRSSGQDRPGSTRRTSSEWATARARRLTRCSAVSGRG